MLGGLHLQMRGSTNFYVYVVEMRVQEGDREINIKKDRGKK